MSAAGRAGEETPPGLDAPPLRPARASVAGWKPLSPSSLATRGRAQCHRHPASPCYCCCTRVQSTLKCPPAPKGSQAAPGPRRTGRRKTWIPAAHTLAFWGAYRATAAGPRTEPPRVAFPRSACSLAPATGTIKQKNFC